MAKSPPEISVVSPVYFSAESVDELVRRCQTALSQITPDFEIVLVEDGSTDGSWEKIEQNCRKYPFVKGIRLSRNFGQHSAITAGLKASSGNYVIVMDCDLQDDPVYFSDLYLAAKAGNDIVLTRREERQHSYLKNISARVFSRIFNLLTHDKNVNMHGLVGSFSLINRKVVNAFLKFEDYQRHYLLVLNWLGFQKTFVPVKHSPRPFGKSSYSLLKLLNHAIAGVTFYSDRLLYLSISLGLFVFLLACAGGTLLITLYFLHGFREGWTSLMVTILFSTGLILMALGIMGIYVGKTFEQTKNRPLYLVDRFLNFP